MSIIPCAKQSVLYSWLSILCISSVQFSRSVVSDSLRPHESHAACQASLSITNSQSPPMSIVSVMPSNHLILCHTLLLLPLIPPSIRVFSNESIYSSVYMSIPDPKFLIYLFPIILSCLVTISLFSIWTFCMCVCVPSA